MRKFLPTELNPFTFINEFNSHLESKILIENYVLHLNTFLFLRVILHLNTKRIIFEITKKKAEILKYQINNYNQIKMIQIDLKF